MYSKTCFFIHGRKIKVSKELRDHKAVNTVSQTFLQIGKEVNENVVFVFYLSLLVIFDCRCLKEKQKGTWSTMIWN